MMRCVRSVGCAPVGVPVSACASSRRSLVIAPSKGFGGAQTEDSKADAGTAGSSTSGVPEDSAEALEARIRGIKGKKGRIEPKVKVESDIVDKVTSKSMPTAAEAGETAAVLSLGYFFLLVLVEGLLLAGSGFLPESMDQWVQDTLYPGFSPTVLAFLGASSLYGLWKTGKLPGQKQL
ncbi:hypothetical protein FOA52_004116 [Chlamydomonas sp. UWO 241]|nr:hypothetical protein FOA52_004116 [Chlamydomonas sp. UWO 241]